MNELPDFLPRPLHLGGNWDHILDSLYRVFTEDFKSGPVYHQGQRVFYDKRKLPDGLGKEECFWHIISSRDRYSGERHIDFPRAERLPWVRPVMENFSRSEIKYFEYMEGPKDKGVRIYIWLHPLEYVVILQKKKKGYFLITAFCVLGRKKHEDLQKRYENRVK